MQVPVVLYVANIIDYFRVVFLYFAYAEFSKGNSWGFAGFYALSYFLDAFDGIAARALNQTSKLGYYLDMVIDRVSSCLCLHLAATRMLDDYDPPMSTFLAAGLYAALIMVEVVAHGVVMYKAETGNFHQKEMPGGAIVRLYLGNKKVLFWSCVSFEATAMALVMGEPLWAAFFLPGFLFRACANLMRLRDILAPPLAEAVREKSS
ncbi:CDP-diacylglycerol--inositol 3-phosphatidyltransferase [Hondaea fermentalgiana]|uniref:CDP-diacylglycerol--inositol 3-phosphatidyltransferase n=1 Tax=Hondaea fermentalgiana TaxID=2315210 RepID=A0A2R5GQR1_9STRA|nr:CDP-diacylglycerol--inositol 3-phosphatidyltransferase [Hondaea fermentalgiana]|eukprot:GBG32649.1 CDP-diacylglycerol--inositol 3-phosphatidyltransferase [Hondaea fermentalgiana]